MKKTFWVHGEGAVKMSQVESGVWISGLALARHMLGPVVKKKKGIVAHICNPSDRWEDGED
jgi:hypothetical protein